MSPKTISQWLVKKLSCPVARKIPVWLWGSPGLGKSEVTHDVTQQLQEAIVDLRAVLLDPVDVRGLPEVVDHVVNWCIPNFFPRDPDWRGVIFLDELAQAAPLVQSAFLQLVLDRRLGEYELPEGAAIIAASNRVEDRAGAHRVITPLLDRFVHIDFDCDFDEWKAWAYTHDIRHEVVSYLNFRPSNLNQFTGNGGRAQATPRSWKFVSDVMGTVDDTNAVQIISGIVGDGVATEFVAHMKICDRLPDPKKVLASPQKAAVPDDPAVVYALIGALVDVCKKAKSKQLGSYVDYISRLPKDFQVKSMDDIGNVNHQVFRTASGQRWIKENHHYVWQK